MQPPLKPVSIGLFLGMCAVLFGIFWAMYLTVKHERIHVYLEERGVAALEEKFVIAPPADDGHGHGSGAKTSESHEVGSMYGGTGRHGDGLIDEAHKRLTRGHIHAMGLGILSITLSVTLSFLNVPARMKTVASACMGVGGLFYPFAWIIMGYRTTALGAEGAAKSVLPIVAFSVFLVFAAILLTLVYLIKGLTKKMS
ncbi:MAG: hypothetical protein HY884_07065 [Deltaproteobacteria bacterium]|nr:hypothetical protein [Deltaproteobacteria bacterium]